MSTNRRAIETRRAVRVNEQVKSHKRFASNFQSYCQLVDNVRLYCSNAMGRPPAVMLDLILSVLIHIYQCLNSWLSVVWSTNLISMINAVDSMERGRQQATGWSWSNQMFDSNQHFKWRCREHLWALQAAKPRTWRGFGLERHCSVTFQSEPSTGAQNIYSENRKLESKW